MTFQRIITFDFHFETMPTQTGLENIKDDIKCVTAALKSNFIMTFLSELPLRDSYCLILQTLNGAKTKNSGIKMTIWQHTSNSICPEMGW